MPPRRRGGHDRHVEERLVKGVIPALAGRTDPHDHRRRRSWGHPRGGGADKQGATATLEIPGVIPALAGRTQHDLESLWGSRGHPRAGGADHALLERRQLGFGSSPRWRGGPGSDQDLGVFDGVIPALAGRTYVAGRWLLARPGHPRAGGADDVTRTVEHWYRGSSPRWRGGRRASALEGCHLRVIPALAGRT